MFKSAQPTDVPESPVARLRLVDRIVAAIGRRHLLEGAELEDFGSWVRARVIADDYAVFRKFGGRSSIETFLTVVLSRMFVDYRNEQWGRWRPSAAAVRLGPLAVRLERMIYRDGYPPREAIESIRTASPGVASEELRRVLAAIPPRQKTRQVGIESAESLPSTTPDDFWAHDVDNTRRETEAAIRALVDNLPAEDRIIVQLRYWQGATIAEIARILKVEQKPLYRRLERIQSHLQDQLSRSGIERDRIDDILNDGEAA